MLLQAELLLRNRSRGDGKDGSQLRIVEAKTDEHTKTKLLLRKLRTAAMQAADEIAPGCRAQLCQLLPLRIAQNAAFLPKTGHQLVTVHHIVGQAALVLFQLQTFFREAAQLLYILAGITQAGSVIADTLLQVINRNQKTTVLRLQSRHLLLLGMTLLGIAVMTG